MTPALINPADNPLTPEFYRLLWHNFSPALAPFLLALGVTIALVPPVRALSFRLGAVSPPGGRHINDRPVARLGGMAMALGFVVAAGLFAVRSSSSGPSDVRTVAIAGLLAVVALGVDDLRKGSLRARTKIVIQLGLAIIVVLMGTTIQYVNPGIGHVIHLGVLAIPVTLLWLVGMQNTVNLLDGVDGLAAGVAAIVAAALLLAAVNREIGHPEQVTVVVLCAALAGACAGFLVFNFHPASIFMGDSGSHFLGITLGVLSIFGIAKGAVVFVLAVPMMALAVPIFDTALAVIRRRRQGLSIAHPDTAHIHHQLLDFGLSQRETCLVFYAATGISGGLGLMLFGHRKILAVVVLLLVIGLSTLLGGRLYEIERGGETSVRRTRAEADPLLES